MDQFSHDPFGASTPSEGSAANRTGARDSLFLAAQFIVDGRDAVQARVRNLSTGGLMADYALPVKLGDRVSVELRGIGWVPGRIAWAAEGRVGVAFDVDIDPKLARKPVGKGSTTPEFAKAPIFPR